MPETPVARSYGCTFGCGNPYDYIIVTVADGTTELVCLPCFLKLASDVLEAVMNPDNPDVMAAVADAKGLEQTAMNGSGPKPRGRNAPATNDDPDLFDAFDSVITVDDLPDEFK